MELGKTFWSPYGLDSKLAAEQVTVHSLFKGSLWLHLIGSTSFLITLRRQERGAQAQVAAGPERGRKTVPLDTDASKGDDGWKEEELHYENMWSH